VLNHVNIDSGPEWLVKSLHSNSIDNLLDGEVRPFGSLAV
jgi:hypothetical protein